MKYKWIIILLVLAVAFGGAFYYAKQPKALSPIIEVPAEKRPCVINGVLYSVLNETPITQIYKVTFCHASVRFVILEWKENNLHGGMFTMRFEDFMKIYPYLQANPNIVYQHEK